MDCDDEVGLVKRNNDPHKDTSNFSGVTGLSPPITIEIDRFLNDPFYFLD